VISRACEFAYLWDSCLYLLFLGISKLKVLKSSTVNKSVDE
jgi:hypothetical protein